MRAFFANIIVATAVCVGPLAACSSSAKPAATVKAPAPVVAPQECETDTDCKPGQHCVLEQVRDDADSYDPNATDEPNRAPIVEENRFCE